MLRIPCIISFNPLVKTRKQVIALILQIRKLRNRDFLKMTYLRIYWGARI